MATNITRISVRDVGGTNTYLFPINPNSADLKDSVDYNLVETLDGAPARLTTSFDSRVRTLKWPAYPSTNTTFMTMVGVLKGYKGLTKQIYLGDLDSAYSFSWRNIKILDVGTVLQDGGTARLSLYVDYHYTESY